MVIGEPRIIPFTGDFDPIIFKGLGQGWKILPEETDQRGEALTELDITKVIFKIMLEGKETSVKGEEKLKRLKATGCICLDGKAFKACWGNRHLLPESWKKDENGKIRYIFFDGIVLQGPCGFRCVLCLYFKDGKWQWNYNWLENDWNANNPSAVLATLFVSLPLLGEFCLSSRSFSGG